MDRLQRFEGSFFNTSATPLVFALLFASQLENYRKHYALLHDLLLYVTIE